MLNFVLILHCCNEYLSTENVFSTRSKKTRSFLPVETLPVGSGGLLSCLSTQKLKLLYAVKIL